MMMVMVMMVIMTWRALNGLGLEDGQILYGETES